MENVKSNTSKIASPQTIIELLKKVATEILREEHWKQVFYEAVLSGRTNKAKHIYQKYTGTFLSEKMIDLTYKKMKLQDFFNSIVLFWSIALFVALLWTLIYCGLKQYMNAQL